MSHMMLVDGTATPDRLQVKYVGETVVVSLAGVVWGGTDAELDALAAAFVAARAEARTHQAVLATMLPTKAEQ